MADIINDLIISCVKDQGITALSITHDMHSARKIGDRHHDALRRQADLGGTGGGYRVSGNPYVDQFVHGAAEGPIKMQVRG